MQIKVGSEIKIGAKKRMIVEIQTDAFDWQQNQVCFDDKSKVLQGDLVREHNAELQAGREVAELAREHSIIAATIPKKDLVDGAIYKGFCRNSEYAIWCAAYDQFEYRWKQGSQEITDYIKHPEDEKRYDVFTPFEKVSDGLVTLEDWGKIFAAEIKQSVSYLKCHYCNEVPNLCDCDPAECKHD